MPNLYSGTTEVDGAGAVGTRALGINAGDNNQVRKQKLYNFLKDKNTNGTAWEKMGSALIVHQMLNKPKVDSGWGDAARTISSSEWSELNNKLVLNTNIKMVREYYAGTDNTSGTLLWTSPRVYDASRYTYSEHADVDSWVFYNGSGRVYALEVMCANPLGSLDGLPDFDVYSLTPTLSITNASGTALADGAEVSNGTKITARDSVNNAGPDTSQSTQWTLTRLIYAPDTNLTASQKAARDTASDTDACGTFTSAGRSDCSTPRNQGSQEFPKGQTNRDSNTKAYTVSLAPGTKVCFVSSVKRPTQNSSPVWRHSAMRCVTVAAPAKEFNLIPDIDLERNDEGITEPGSSTRVTQTVTNQGEDPSNQTTWQLTVLTYGPTTKVTDTNERDGGGNACASFGGNGPPVTCEVPAEQKLEGVTFNGNASRTFDPVFVYNVPDDMPIGTKVCFVSSVSPPTQNNTPLWRHSEMKCIVIGKKPKIQVWGGDIRSGGKIDTSTSQLSGRTFGSWVEYAALSRGSNSGFSSGAALNNGSPMADQVLWSKLTLANVDDTGANVFGFYNFSLSSSSLAGQFSSAGTPTMSGSYNLNDLASSITPYRAGNITLTGTTISRGKTIIIVADGTVTIQGDIAYEDADYASIRDLPQVVIKARNINIQGNVGRVDAWLLALSAGPDGTINTDDDNGMLNTCSNSTSPDSLTISECNNRLTVNGPVVADIVYLRRTAGSENTGNARGEPAEIFNLRPDAYMWANAYGLGTGRVQTVYSRELAPRF